MSRSAALVVATCLLLCAAQAAGFTVKDLTRKISHKSTISRITDNYELENTGSATDAFSVCYLEQLAGHIGHIRAKLDGARATVTGKDTPKGAPAGVVCYSIKLPSAVKKGKGAKLEVVTSFTDILTANPASIKQGDPQLMVYEDNLYLLSPYPVTKQKAEVLLPSSNVVSHSAGSRSGSKLSLGPFSSIPAFKLETFKAHFEHPGQFKRINKVVREVQVSMWGNVYVEEVYEVQNAGAKHTGKFSRLQFFHNPRGKGNSWQDLSAKLPGAAHSLYFKDLIGNISTSDTRKSSSATVVELRMRYPLMGGWKTDFTLGYSLPLEGFLYRRPKGVYRLLTDFSVPFDDVYIDHLEVRVVLPEGAAKIAWQLPVEAGQTWDKKYTYLDTAGRPVVVFTKDHVLPVHNQPFAVDFKLGTWALLHEPLLLVTAFLALFVGAGVWSRLDFTITRDKAWAARVAKERAAGVLGRAQALWEEQAAVLGRYLVVADQLAGARDADHAHSTRNVLDGELKALDTQVREVLGELEGLSAPLAAAAGRHAEEAKALQARGHRLIGDKLEAVKKGMAAYEASEKVAPSRKQLQSAIADWSAAGATV